MSKRSKLTRRHLLAALSASGGALALPSLLDQRKAHSQPTEQAPPKFLITFGAFGGASIIDSFLPAKQSLSNNPDTINAYTDQQIVATQGSPIESVKYAGSLFGDSINTAYELFVQRHMQDMLVATMTGTSVNHTVAQKRAITGNGAWNGRTMQEAVAHAYGESFPLANVNMAAGGFAAHGDDSTVGAWAYHEPVAVPALWPFALHGSRGVKVTDDGQVVDGPSDELIKMARDLRNTKLDPESSFYTTFKLSPKLQRWIHQRNEVQPTLEDGDFIKRLNMVTEAPGVPLSQYGLESSDDAAAVLAVFPGVLTDPLQAQAALAYLLIKNRVAVSVTIGPSFNLVLGTGNGPLVLNPPLSFDFSHQQHRNAQGIMWMRMLTAIDGLITLLKGVPYDETPGQSAWDNTMIFCASDFGRSKGRPSGANLFGTGHNLNNGVLAISPMLDGNQVLGGVDHHTGFTYGFDPVSGAPDTGREMSEQEIYAGLIQALGIETSGSGMTDMPSMRA
jgi:hypothetical protein